LRQHVGNIFIANRMSLIAEEKERSSLCARNLGSAHSRQTKSGYDLSGQDTGGMRTDAALRKFENDNLARIHDIPEI
jgi:hypothetical protein